MTRTMSENDIVNLLQFFRKNERRKTIRRKIKLKIIYRDDKNLNDKHMIVKFFSNDHSNSFLKNFISKKSMFVLSRILI